METIDDSYQVERAAEILHQAREIEANDDFYAKVVAELRRQQDMIESTLEDCDDPDLRADTLFSAARKE